MKKIKVRFATLVDLDYLTKNGDINKKLTRHKIKSKEILIAIRDKKQVGHLRFEFIWSRIPFIAYIQVLKSYRGKKISTTLLENLQILLKEAGYNVLYSSSEVTKSIAQEWHFKREFEECGIITGINNGGIGQIFFKKDL